MKPYVKRILSIGLLLAVFVIVILCQPHDALACTIEEDGRNCTVDIEVDIEVEIPCYSLNRRHTGDGSNPVALPTHSVGCGTGEYTEGEHISLTAIPDGRWRVDGWSGTANDSSNATTNSLTMPARGATVSVTYLPPCDLLVLSHTGNGSGPVASPSNSPNCSAGYYSPGVTISLSAYPEAGSSVGGWSGTPNDGSTETGNTLVMPDNGATVSVNYVRCYQLTLSHTGTGKDPDASPPSPPNCSAGSYPPEKAISLSAYPATGWRVGGWSGTPNDGRLETTNSFTMPQSISTVSVTYLPPCYKLTLAHTGNGIDPVADPQGSLNCKAGNYNEGANITLSVTRAPDSDSSVGGWTGTNNPNSTLENNSLTMPAGDFTVSVNYLKDSTAPAKGTAVSSSGPVSVDSSKLGFSWNGFQEPETAIQRYEVSLGTTDNPKRYLADGNANLNLSAVICSSAASQEDSCNFRLPIDSFLEGVDYVFSVRAVNFADLASEPATPHVAIDTTAFVIGEVIPVPGQDDLPLVTRRDIDWEKTTFSPANGVIKIDQYDADGAALLVGDYGYPITVNWQFKSSTGRPPISRQYNTTTPVQEAMVIYATHDKPRDAYGALTLAPEVKLNGTFVTIHHNTHVSDQMLWEDKGSLYAGPPKDDNTYAVLEYYEEVSPSSRLTHTLGIDVVQVKPSDRPDAKEDIVDVGSRLLPETQISGAQAYVTRGSTGSQQFIYQHGVQDSPQAGEVWAVQPNDASYKMEIVWQRPGFMGILWPYELRRYTAQWPEPENEPEKYQQYVRSATSGAFGPTVSIPDTLNAVAKFEDIDSGHSYLENGEFWTDGPGWVLLQYQTGPNPGQDWVGFEVVHSVLNTDEGLSNLTPVPWDIGDEIVDSYHEVSATATRPGYIYDPEKDDKYDSKIYDTTTGTGQIFAVNEGALEIWWYNLSRTKDPEGSQYPEWPAERVQWPSKVVHYQASWPIDTYLFSVELSLVGELDAKRVPTALRDQLGEHGRVLSTDAVVEVQQAGSRWTIDDVDKKYAIRRENDTVNLYTDTYKIVIAQQNGSGVIDESRYGSDWSIYYRNDKTLPGFNPNDEHAISAPYESGRAIFALRDDLGTATTSQPYVLMKYKEQPANSQWRFRVFAVVREEWPYYLRDWEDIDYPEDKYQGFAGSPIQAPFPLSTLQYCQETEAILGPFLEDRKGNHWAMAAGDDGGSDDITMQYYYPVKEGFFFPETTHAAGDCVPWLDNNTGTPVDVVYTISWPDEVPTMRVGETLIEAMRDLPAMDGQLSVEIIYQQSVANGGGPSVILIDPVQTHSVKLEKLPGDIIKESIGGIDTFPKLTLALRLRVNYDSINGQLLFKGIRIKATTGFDYALMNVMSERERDELLTLSTDEVWQTAVKELHTTSNKKVDEITDIGVEPFGMLALSSGFAQGTGYVTLAMQNANNPKLVPEASSVSLEIIRVVPELDPSALTVITPFCPFDETLTMRYRGDFGGHTDRYKFEWKYLPGTVEIKLDNNGNLLEPLPEDPAWSKFTPEPANGVGANDITIAGPGLLTLSDNYVIGRFMYRFDGLPWSGQWSEWTEPQLAEGWIKRIMGDVNPFDQRGTGGGIEGAENSFFSYGDREVNTVVSMISQAGEPWTGDVPLNCENLDGYGLLQIYETVYGRGRLLSIDGLPAVDYPPANQALLLVASRIVDLYMLLGNEAYADAADPTIAFGTEDGQYSEEATFIYSFMNMTSSLLDEELALLRGRDDAVVDPGVKVHPVYNRLFWNFTNDQTGGEVAYALNYNIHDSDGNGVVDRSIDEADAKTLYPQGHGDAWGYYLTAMQSYYQLLRHPQYTWNARAEGVLVAGQPVCVDYLDERKFATAAAAKARTGAEIVNLTYRSAYVEDPTGQWQGYKDVENPERAWGVAEWASRSGQGAYLDWVVGNAILPAEDRPSASSQQPTCTSVQNINRTSVLELREVASRYDEIQSQVDMADLGLNPLGLAANVVPFDINPAEIDQGKTHFEQIYERSVSAMNNAITVFNHANNATQLLRRQADTQEDFVRAVENQEVDFKNRLIEIFGYPYADDIGPGGTYPSGYDGPDLDHYAVVDKTELTGEHPDDSVIAIPVTMTGFDVADDGSLETTEQEVVYHFSTSAGRYGLVKPEEWTSERRAPGELQMAQSDLIQMEARFEKTLVDYDNLLARIEDQAELLKSQYSLNAEEIKVLNTQLQQQETLDNLIANSRRKQLDFRSNAQIATIVSNAVAEALPTSVGMAVDPLSVGRSAIRLVGSAIAQSFSQNADRESLVELDQQQAAQAMQAETNITLTSRRNEQAIQQLLRQLEQDVRQEHSLRLELYTMQEALLQSSGRYMAALARGQRLLEERQRFRSQTASQVQERRYKDMAFRIFRNDALQKYRAQFDLAARYVYLAAKAYDYETTFLSSDPRAGEEFLTDIVRARLIGTIQGGLPQTGIGLADPMARMWQNFSVLKGQLGFNNPQRETNRFSLRSEFFRVGQSANDDELWRQTLRSYVVPNLLDLPEFQRYARYSSAQGVEPGIVIPFETTVNSGLNFFRRPLLGGDSAYDSTNFTTKVRSVGVWFGNYNTLQTTGLSNTPRVYLIPVGADIQRSPTGFGGQIREFMILDQVLPAPFPIGGSDLNDPGWIPSVDTLNNTFAPPVRRYSSFRAYHDSGEFKVNETARDSRLIGRSVWNTRWLLIIPASTLLQDRQEALDRFIGDNPDDPSGGVSDISIFFETYAYPGN